jgi:uncharacterized membrane protein (DUF2068 family)
VKQQRSDGILRLIAAFKFFKAMVLAAAGLGALEMVQPIFAGEVRAWAQDLAAVINNEAVGQAVIDVTGLSAQRLHVLGIIAFLYVALFITEGTGLWLGRRWAEFLTVFATFSLIPFEIYELIRRVTLARAGTLAINIAVLVYLIYRLRRDRTDSGSDSRPPPA